MKQQEMKQEMKQDSVKNEKSKRTTLYIFNGVTKVQTASYLVIVVGEHPYDPGQVLAALGLALVAAGVQEAGKG